MTDKVINEEIINGLYDVLIKLKTRQDCADLLADLCTIKEVENMAQRIAAAKALMEGKTYNEVTEAADISSATLSRISRCVQHGKGYVRFLKDDSEQEN